MVRKNLQLIILGVLTVLFCVGTAVYGEQKYTEERNADFLVSVNSEFPQQDITFASNSSDLARVGLYRNEKYHEWDAYIPADLESDLHIYFTKFAAVRFGDEIICRSGDRFPIWTTNTAKSVTIIKWDGTEQPLNEGIRFFYGDGTSTLYLGTAEGMDAVNNDAGVSAGTRYLMTDRYRNRISSGTASIQLSNERSQAYQQKPYELQLENAAALMSKESAGTLSIDRSNHWYLLPNYLEGAEQERSRIAYDLAARLGVEDTPQGDFVNVYADGQYLGLYLLEEKTDDTAAEEKVGASVQALTADQSTAGSSSDQLDVIRAAVQDGSIWKILDEDSFARVYLLKEFMACQSGTFAVSRDPADGLLHAGSPWDYVLSCGYTTRGDYLNLTRQTRWLADDGIVEETDADSDSGTLSDWNDLLKILGEDPSFQGYVEDSYQNDMAPILKDYVQNDLPLLTYRSAASSLMSEYHFLKDADADTALWDVRKWLIDRKDFLDAYYQDPSSYVKMTFLNNGFRISYYAREGEQLRINPVTANGEGNRTYMEDPTMTETITGWVDDQGNALTSDTVVTRDMEARTFTAVTEPVPEDDSQK